MLESFKWKFQKHTHFGFVIPDNRDEFWGDFFVNKNNMKDAQDGDKVEARPLKNFKGKKPEAKILQVLTGKPKNPKKIVEWVYSGWDGNFGFVDVPGQEKGFFVYGNKKNGARDGDKVQAEVIKFKGKDEAIVLKVLEQEKVELIQGTFRDNERFGFVVPDDNSGDIFIAWSRKNGAEEWDEVLVKIIKTTGKNPEGVIDRVL